MKKRKLTTILLTGAMAAAMVGTAYAAPTKTATLNNAQVRFNGGAVQTLQCYNIDGYNYVRARDITNNLNMALYPIQSGGTGVMVDTLNQPTSKATPEKLTQKTAQVQMQTGNLIYDGMPSEAECFLLNGRYYFKLADFQKAAEYQKSVAIDTVEIEAKAMIATEPYQDTFYSIAVEWNADSKVIDVKRTETDLWAVFNNIRGSKAGTPKAENSETTKAEEKKQESKPTTSDTTEASYAEEVLRLVNEEREKAGVAPLKLDSELTKAAQCRAKEITETFSHTRPNGENFRTILDEMGIDSSYAGENIGGGYASPKSAVTAWMNSEGHRSNILNPNYNYLGVGFVNSGTEGYHAYWVQIFSK